MRPMIGITTYAEEASWGGWTEPAAFTPLAYVRAVEQAGGRPLLVPPSDDAIEETLDALDGIIFSGGGDLDPEHYDAELHPETTGIVAERDSGRAGAPPGRSGPGHACPGRLPREPGC